NVFLPIGFDDNGQPTERLIEKKHNLKPNEIPRKEFNKLVRKEIKIIEEGYKKDLIRLGHSFDWSNFYRTISDYCMKTSQFSFLDLFEKKLVYRGEEPNIWCTYCHTALSQADVEDKTKTTKLNYIYFELEDKKKIEIATTRPELLPSCVGLFVHPNDDRYKKIVGKKAKVPIFGQMVPIMEDEKVGMEFGSGIVMICTFGDTTDIEWWKKHDLPMKISINKNGTLNEICGKYEGMKIEEARKKITDDLKENGMLFKQEDLSHDVGCCWRCGTPVEFIPTKQWFVKIKEHKEKFIEQGEKVKWYPDYYRKRYEDWIKNLKWDWCISRQRHFGIPIPVWYCKNCGKIIIPDKEELPIDPKKQKPSKKCECGSNEFIAEEDVFDTWFTSSLTPELALGWIDNNPNFENNFPENLRPSAHDIIRNWAFYTIVKAYYHFKKIPWKNIMISGHVLDPKGRAMHKSLGNSIDPRDMIEKYSADALRYWSVTVRIGDDVPFQEKELVRGRKLILKLWNSARFVSMHLDKKPKETKLEVADKWILSRMYETIENSENYMKKYEISKARKEIEMFFLHEFCDFYLEMVKYRLYGDDEESKDAVKFTLYNVMLNILKMWAPFIPHVTEELYQEIFLKYEKEKSIHISRWPETGKIDKEVLELGEMITELISLLRQYKTQKDMAMNTELNLMTIDCNNETMEKIKEIENVIKGTMKIKEIKYGKVEDGLKGEKYKIDIEA
ncbi:MAG: valine--tRNA ligase, partial [Candidatus Aenigmarchaeota archaeon]|nr:valine--tRNA ligase [Candidatus Aenigmarchaeota archaeon]